MIFKKHISLFLVFFLLVSNLGLAFNVHYCGDKIDAVSLNLSPQNVYCCCRIVEKETSCCNDKIIKAEIKSDQIIVKFLTFTIEFISVFPDWKSIVFVSKSTLKKRDKIIYNCAAKSQPLYLLHSQYIFYC